MSYECSECEHDLRGGHDSECSRYRDPRDSVCEAASDYILSLSNAEFAKLNGGSDALLKCLRDAVFAWEHPDGL